jgi:hypothetical protein
MSKTTKKHQALTIPGDEHTGPATMDDLWVLWHLLRENLQAIMEGEPSEITAADYNVCRQFLKDNGAALNAAHKVPLRKGLQELGGYALPFVKTEQ